MSYDHECPRTGDPDAELDTRMSGEALHAAESNPEIEATVETTVSRLVAGARHLMSLANDGVIQGIKNRTIDF